MKISTQTVFNLMQQGRLGDAETLCRLSLEQVPDDSDMRLLLALNLQDQARHSDAVEVYADLTRRFPDDGMHWGNYATALREMGQNDEAMEAYAVSLRLAPDDFDQLINLGMLQLRRKEFLSARDTLLRAHAIDPQSPRARIGAARACSVCRDYRADELISPWRHWLPLEDPQQLDLADLHLLLGDANTARWLLEDLLTRSPAHLPAKLLLAAVLERMNQLDMAESKLNQAVSDSIEFDTETSLEVAHQKAMIALRRGDLPLARRTLEDAGPRNPDDYAHFFTLAEICDKSGDAIGALAALELAHSRQLDELRLSAPYRFEPDAPILPAAVGRVTAQEYLRWPALKAPDSQNSPVFIVGFPRSGTTLLEQMLDAHPRLQSMDERPFFNILSDQLEDYDIQVPQDLNKLDQTSCDELRKGYLTLVCSKISRRWDAQLVDKNPLNMLWLPMIHRLFPNAKFILALRHPCDVVVSNYMQNFRSSVLALASASLERTALAYVTAMGAWLHHVDVFKPDVFVSRYEDLVSDPALQAQRLAEFIGVDRPQELLQFDRHARDKGYIATPSYAQVIQPVNRKGLNRWHRYHNAMASAVDVLQPMLDHWGYTIDVT